MYYKRIIYAITLCNITGRILSVAWHSAEEVIVTGGVDNIRVWSLASGHAIQRLTLAKVNKNKETIVWTVAVTKYVDCFVCVTLYMYDYRYFNL